MDAQQYLKEAFFNSQYWILAASEYHFVQNRQKSLSLVVESPVRVVGCSKLFQKFASTLINIFYMYNKLKKCIESNLRAKNGASSIFEKSFFQILTRLHFWLVDYFLCISQARYTCKKCLLESRKTFGITQSIIRRIQMTPWQEKEIFSILRKSYSDDLRIFSLEAKI